MKKTIIVFITSLAFALSFGLLSNSKPASAATYKITNIKYLSSTAPDAQPYKNKTNQNVTMWNRDYTKKVHNLKTYYKTTWYVGMTATIKNGNKATTAWYIMNASNSVQGWVSPKALTKGYNFKGYPMIQKKWYNDGATYYLKNSKQDAYMWNWKHSKTRINLKDYPGMSWNRTESVVMQHGNKKAVYYYLQGRLHGNGKYVSGYVWRGYLKKGLNPNHTGQNFVYPDSFTSSSNYTNYINTATNQKLTKQVAALFPNSPIDLKLSQIAIYNYGSIDEYIIGDEDITQLPTSGYTNIISFNSVTKKLMANYKLSDAKKLAIVKKELAKLGYSASKRAKMTDYHLGIYMIDNVSDPYYGIVQDGGYGYANGYGLVLAKKG